MLQVHINILERQTWADQVLRKDERFGRNVCYNTERIGNCNLGTQIKIVSQSRENKQVVAKDVTFQAESALQEILGLYLDCEEESQEECEMDE